MTSPKPLEYGQYYHIYNRGNSGENLFFEERNYRHFLELYVRYIEPVADTFAYCLLRNHFHVLVYVKTVEEQVEAHQTPRVRIPGSLEAPRVLEEFKPQKPSQQFGNLFNAYAKAVNKAYGRTRSLFENPFGRKLVTSDAYFAQLIAYIHYNPQKHGFVDDFRAWDFSSFHAMLSRKPTRLKRDVVLDWFDGASGFRAAHRREVNESLIAPLVADDYTQDPKGFPSDPRSAPLGSEGRTASLPNSKNEPQFARWPINLAPPDQPDNLPISLIT